MIFVAVRLKQFCLNSQSISLRLRLCMESALQQGTTGFSFPTVDLFLVDWETIDRDAWCAEFLGDGPHPPSCPATVLQPAPLWQMCEGSSEFWEWLSASDQPSHADLGWQANGFCRCKNGMDLHILGPFLG